MTKRVILFDVDGVLIHGWHSKPEKRRRWDVDLRADLGVESERFSGEFIPGLFVKEVLTGKLSLIDALSEWLPANGYAVSPMNFAAYWFDKDSVCNEELFALVRKIKATGKTRLFVATNQEHLRAQHLWQTVGLGGLFDDMFHAARIGALKPDPAYFARVTDIIGPTDEAPLLFDDSEDVIIGARRAGWEAVLYDEIEDCAGHPAIREILGG